MKKLLTGLLVFGVLLFPAIAALPIPAHAAVDLFKTCAIETVDNSVPSVCKDADNQTGSDTNPIIEILRVVLIVLSFVAGLAVVLLLIVNGLRLILSNGDSNGVKNARSGIVYVLVGLAVVLSAQIIVIFVLDKL